MSLNLITDPWIPIRRRDGTSEDIRPADIVDFGADGDNPPVELDAARPDFNGALIQFLIGLIQTFAAPENEDQWWDLFESRPAVEELHAQFLEFKDAFELLGQPRFMQELDDLPEKRSKSIFDLFVDSPGNSTKNHNKDIFNKRRDSYPLCLRCAGLAILTMQLNAPGGGRGHRTSIRGGGPFTTVLRGHNLWHDIWLNIRPLSELDGFPKPSQDNLPAILPWTAPTRLSDSDGSDTYPDDCHPAQLFWATPRRLQIDLPIECESDESCAACGDELSEAFLRYRDKSYGVNYEGPWVHPLTPYTFAKDNEPNPLKGRSDGSAYKYWVGLISRDEDDGLRPARVIGYFRDFREHDFAIDLPEYQVNLWAFGYDVDNAKVISWQDGQMPLIAVPDDKRDALDQFAEHLIKGSDEAEGRLTNALKRGLYGTVKDVTSTGKKKWKYDDRASRDKSLFKQASVQFWRDTEGDFYDLLGQSTSVLDDADELDALKRRWVEILRDSSLALFDRLTAYGNFHNSNPKSLALARNSLRWFFHPEKGGIKKPLHLLKAQPKGES